MIVFFVGRRLAFGSKAMRHAIVPSRLGKISDAGVCRRAEFYYQQTTR